MCYAIWHHCMQDDVGNTALHTAVYNKKVDVLTLLLDQEGINLELKNSENQTPMEMAKEYGYAKIVQLLANHTGK